MNLKLYLRSKHDNSQVFRSATTTRSLRCFGVYKAILKKYTYYISSCLVSKSVLQEQTENVVNVLQTQVFYVVCYSCTLFSAKQIMKSSVASYLIYYFKLVLRLNFLCDTKYSTYRLLVRLSINACLQNQGFNNYE